MHYIYFCDKHMNYEKILVALSIVLVFSGSCATRNYLTMKNVIGIWKLKSITSESKSGTMTTKEENHPNFFKEYRADGTYENRVGNRISNSGHFEIERNYIKESVAFHDNPFINLAGKTVNLNVKLLNKNELKFSYSLPNGVYATELWVKERLKKK